MANHFELSDGEFEQQFQNCTLDPELFTHEAHLRLAWIHIHQYGNEAAEENVSNQLKKFVASVGAEDKYHETVTIAAVKAVYHFMLQSKTRNFPDFIEENKQLLTHFKNLLSSHYQIDIFSSEEARSTFIQPDLAPFD